MGTRKRKTAVTAAVLVGAAALLLLGNRCASMPASVKAWRVNLSATTTRDGHHLSYLDVGPRDGKVIVLAHGLPTSSYLYRNVIPPLTAHGYRVLAPDLVGFGASTKPEAEAQYGFALQAERLLALLDELHVGHFSLVVHDLGGLVGWELLEKQPTRVERLLVLNTTAYTKGFTPPEQMRQLGGAMGGMMSAMMGGSLFGPTLTGKFIRDNTGDAAKVDDVSVENYWWPLHEGATVPMRAIAKSFDAIMGEFPRYQAALRRFRGLAMVLWGMKDPVLRFDAIAPQFAADLRVPLDRMRSIPDAGHFLMIDHPEKVSATIVELMALQGASDSPK